MKVHEIFRSIQGEGLYTGCPTTFVRFAGCSVGCLDCDTVYAREPENKITDDKEINPHRVAALISHVDENPIHICLTGGEPLEQDIDELATLIEVLLKSFSTRSLLSLTIETSGTKPIISLLMKLPPREAISRWGMTKLSISMDCKTPSQGDSVVVKTIKSNYRMLTFKDIIKFVCKDDNDFFWALSALKNMSADGVRTNVFFHTVGGMPDKWLPEFLLRENLSWTPSHFDIRFGVQLHKLISMR